MLEEFEDMAMKLFPISRKVVDRREIQLGTATTKCYLPDKNKTVPVWKAKAEKNLNTFAAKMGSVKRV